MSRIAVLFLLTCAFGVGVSSSATAEQIAPPPGSNAYRVAPLLASYEGLLAWSEVDVGSSSYALTARYDNRRFRVPVPPRSVPFDVSAGPDANGRPVLVYSRCRQEPGNASAAVNGGVFTAPTPPYTMAKGCDVYRFDLSTMRESRVSPVSTSGASEMLPAIWKDEIAFVRVYDQRSGRRGTYPYVYVRTKDRTMRQPGGARGTSGLPGPTWLTIGDAGVAFVWNYSTDRSRRRGISTVRFATAPGRRAQQVGSVAFRRDLDNYASYVSPTLSGNTLVFGQQRISGLTGGARPAASSGSYVLRRNLRTGRTTRQQTPPFLISVRPSSGGASALGIASDGDGFLTSLGVVQRQ